MKKKLKRQGNSLGIIIDKPILEALGWDETTPLELTVGNNSVIFTGIKEDQAIDLFSLTEPNDPPII